VVLALVLVWLLGNATFVALRLRATRPSSAKKPPRPVPSQARLEMSRRLISVSLACAVRQRPRYPVRAATATGAAQR
jgi:hypothetical protein